MRPYRIPAAAALGLPHSEQEMAVAKPCPNRFFTDRKVFCENIFRNQVKVKQFKYFHFLNKTGTCIHTLMAWDNYLSYQQ